MLSVHNWGRLWRHDVIVLWLMKLRDSRDHLIGLPNVCFVVPRTFRPVGFLTIRVFLKLLRILMVLNNKKVNLIFMFPCIMM
jgi:hypothetical protein